MFKKNRHPHSKVCILSPFVIKKNKKIKLTKN